MIFCVSLLHFVMHHPSPRSWDLISVWDNTTYNIAILIIISYMKNGQHDSLR
jgi:hypothetical protein